MKSYPFILLILFGIFVRIQSLGYSNFQGDEVNTIDFIYPQNSNFLEYLFAQKKGPIQFLINFLNINLFGYNGEFQIRLPYLICGILAIPLWYLLASKILDKKTGLITAVLLSINGLFISFSRITQYQSVMYFLMPVSIFLFIYAVKTQTYRSFVLAGSLAGSLILLHYDGGSVLFFILPAILLILRDLYINNRKIPYEMIKKFAVYLVVIVAVNALFYLPYLFGNESFDNSTKGYLNSRLLGGGFMPRTEITIKLLSMYIPNVYLYALFVTSICGIFVIHYKNISSKLIRNSYPILCLLLVASTWFSLYPIKPRSASLLFIVATLIISAILILKSSSSWRKISLTIWYLCSFSFYLYFVRDPRTHVYMAILPGLILSATFFTYMYNVALNKNRYLSNLLYALFLGSILYLAGLYWVMYVNKSPEYPWFDKQYMGNEIYHISESNRIDGVFGFNNYRGWDQVGALFKAGCLANSTEAGFESNEKDNITYFYVGIKQKEGDKWSNENGAATMVIVEGPHSWTYVDRREFSGYKLLKTIYSNEVPVTYIFGKNSVYPEGKLLCE